ncbi:hypothetical protein [Streptomyces sp. NPDC096095]|uniref:hypothetical protein n=1 Tax=Streptomyces sp. NPDC096095 TaxID=3155545 RepID=UPI0033190D3B
MHAQTPQHAWAARPDAAARVASDRPPAKQGGWEGQSGGQRERLVELGVRPPEKPAVEAKGRPPPSRA